MLMFKFVDGSNPYISYTDDNEKEIKKWSKLFDMKEIGKDTYLLVEKTKRYAIVDRFNNKIDYAIIPTYYGSIPMAEMNIEFINDDEELHVYDTLNDVVV